MKITAIIIAKNEENMIEDCLVSITFCDEILLIDAGSSDNTIEIGEKFGAKIIRVETDDFSVLRNVGRDCAKSEWIFYIDADERVTPDLKKFIKSTIYSDAQYVAYRIKRKNYYLGNHEWPAIDMLERLFKKENLKKWYGSLHESPLVEGKIGNIDGFLLHYSHRDLSSMLKKTIAWSSIEAKLRYKAHHPTMSYWRFPRVMIPTFIQSYILQRGIFIGIPGLIESIYQSFSIAITYMKLWELQEDNK